MSIWVSDDGLTRYTQGPDCGKGPNCCCGTCNFVKLGNNCMLECCKCIPRWLCAVWTPDVPGEGEDEIPLVHAIMPHNDVTGYAVNLPGIDVLDVDNSITVDLQKPNLYNECFWTVEIRVRGITQHYEIEGGKTPCGDTVYDEADDRLTCQNPYFRFDDFVLNGNTGTLVIQRKMLQTVPFFSLIEGQSTEAIEPCGYCAEYCNRICLEWTNGATTRKDEFVLVLSEGGDQIYAHPYGDGESATIAIQQNADGECELAITHRDLGTFNPVPIPDGMCAVGMSIESGDEYEPGKSVIISCNRCSCWDYICESCRCVCPVLCVIEVDGATVGDISRVELPWDRELLRWGSAEKWVAVRANAVSGDCEFVSSSWIDEEHDTADSNLDAECGGEMSYFLARALPEAVIDGQYRLEWGQCRRCEPDCFGALSCSDCCDACDGQVLPDTLFFDLIGRPVAGDPEPGPYSVKCIEVYDLPLVHVEPLFAEKHRWDGRFILECGCPIDAETPDPSPNTVSVVVSITCTGGDAWTLSIILTASDGTLLGSDTVSVGNLAMFTFSCDPVAMTGEVEIGNGLGGVRCCCDLMGTIDFAVSE